MAINGSFLSAIGYIGHYGPDWCGNHLVAVIIAHVVCAAVIIVAIITNAGEAVA